MPSVRTLSRIYLTLVPFLVALLAFTIGHISYALYVPIWMMNGCLMLLAAWVLGPKAIRTQNQETKQLVISAYLLIIPWVFIALFGGMGPPPATAEGWVATATEQQIRYAILVGSGVLVTLGFAVLRNQLKRAGEDLYSQLGLVLILLAMPLFLLNMIYWGSFLTESFKLFATSASPTRPDWYLPLRALFGWVSSLEVALIYLATAAFAVSLRRVRWFNPLACRIYVGISLLGFLLSVLPTFSNEPLTIAGYAVSIPAIPFMMPFLMGINLLRRIGKEA